MWNLFLVAVLCVSAAVGQRDPPIPAVSFAGNMTGGNLASSDISSTSLPATGAHSTTFLPTSSPDMSSSVTLPVEPPTPLPPNAGTPIEVPSPSPTHNFLVGVANVESHPEGAQMPPHAGIPVDQDEEEQMNVPGPEHAPMHWPMVPPPFYGHHPFAGMPPPGSEFGHLPFHMAGMPPMGMNFPPGMNMSGMGNMPMTKPMPMSMGGMHPHMPMRSMQPMMFPPMQMGPDHGRPQMRTASRGALRRMGVSMMEPRASMMGSLVKVIQGTPVNGAKNKNNMPANSLVPLPVQMGTPTNTSEVSFSNNQTTVSPATIPPLISENGGQQGNNQHLTRSMLPSSSVDI